MGQNTFNCQGEQTIWPDFLKRQMKIYAWRADSNYNSFISRAFLKDSQTLKQQEKFSELIRLQNANNYLQIDKFRKEILQLPEDHQQIIMFEKYYGCLNRLVGLFALEQAVYTLHSLLLGYEQITKMFNKIVVSSNCCFITNDGCVRAWINPNFKSNQVWTGQYGEQLLENETKAIIMQIINVVQQSSSKSQRMAQFFWMIRSKMNKIMLKQYEFVDVRKIINQFCFINNIQNGRGLQRLVERLRLISQSERQINAIKEPAISCPRFKPNDEKNYLSTIESDNNTISRNKFLLMKSKSLESRDFKSPNFITQKPSFMKGSEKKNIVMLMPCPQPSTSSQIVQNCNQRIQQFGKYSEIVNRKSNRLSEIKQQPFTVPINQNPDNATTNGILKNSSILKNKLTRQLPSCRNSAQNACFSNISQSRQLIREKEEKNILIAFPHKQVSSPQKGMDKKQACHGKKTMEISLIQDMQNQSNFYKDKTTCKDGLHKNKIARYSVERSADQNNFQRSWITTKTITKLISDNDSESLQNSIKQSSDFYNDSSYSGALTQMGRDAEIIESDRHSTIQKISKKS